MKTVRIPNQEYPKNYHMKFVRKTMLLLGIWPIKTGDIREILYELYFWITFVYYIIFNVSGFAIAILTWSNNYLATASSMGIVIEYVSNAYKVIIFKSKRIKSLLAEIEQEETKIFESNDPEFINMYTKNAAYNRKIVLFYTIMGTTGISLYFITPLVSNVLTPLEVNNITGIQNHHFVVFTWFPFDPNRYYWAAYLIQFLGCLIGYSYIVHCGAFYISILSFISVQLKIMQHIFINFQKYADEFKRNDLSEDQLQCILIKRLAKKHLRIIVFVREINNAIKLFTLMNFVISSFQLSLVVYQIFKLLPLQRIAVFSYFMTLSTQLFLTYQAAHIISIESENIATSIFKGNWDTYSPKVLKMLQIICVRAQRPLVLTIGPMADVKVTSLFQIFKALYSYICIIMRV
uniref:Odorant receptor n=1 Tax=Eucryptorrhynchus scrobiculatus TaxID=1552824 RepID=A0A8F4RRB5_EUCSC|nr:odorant receptor 48 [Eucryptorrhynchus scrobiculatus]